MYVISLILNGRLKQTALKRYPNEAVALAHQWISEHKGKRRTDGYVAVDEQQKGKALTKRIAEIQFDDDLDKVRLYLNEKEDLSVFTSNFSPVLKSFLYTVLEVALVKLTEYMKNQKDGREYY